MAKLTLPPSSANRWFKCPGSAALEKVYGERKPSKYANEGILAHSILAKLLKKEEVNWGDVSPEMQINILSAYDHIRDIRESGEVISELIEEKLDTGRSFGTVEPSFGYVDYAALVRSDGGLTLWVADFKYGKGIPVRAKFDKQLISYAQAVLDKWVIVGREGIKINMCISQPRIFDILDIWSIGGSELNKHVYALKQSVTVAGAGFTEIHALGVAPSKHVCHFCSSKLKCKGLIGMVNDILKAYELEGFNGDPQLIYSLVESRDINELAVLVDKIEVLELLKKAILSKIEDTIKEGGNVNGWGVGAPTLGNRKYRDSQAVLDRLRDDLSLGKAPFGVIEELPLSPSQIMKVVKKKDFPELYEFLETSIIRDVKLGTVQRIYEGEEAELDTSVLPVREEV